MNLYQSARDLALSHELNAFFQPILELRGDALRLVAFEGFAHGTDGSYLAAPGLQEAAFEADLDRTALDLARLSHVVRASAGLPSTAQLSLNIHISTLALFPEFPGFLAECAASVRIPMNRLILELCVRGSDGQGNSHLGVLEELRTQGVTLALDDVGVREANLDQIIELRPGILKLSPYLTQGLLRDPRRQAILEGLVDMTRKMGGQVLAKNLESVEDFRIARWMGVTLLQGYLFGVAGPVELWKEHPFPLEWHLRSFLRQPPRQAQPTGPISPDRIH